MKIEVKVKPHSGKQEIEKISDSKYLAHLKAQLENNKANIELIKLLKKHFKKPAKIVRGKTSRRKVIEISP